MRRLIVLLGLLLLVGSVSAGHSQTLAGHPHAHLFDEPPANSVLTAVLVLGFFFCAPFLFAWLVYRRRAQQFTPKVMTHEDLFKGVKVAEDADELHPDQHFKLVNGKSAGSLQDLITSIKEISEDEYLHHVTPERNDFATWIADVLQNEKLGAKIAETTSKEELLNELEK